MKGKPRLRCSSRLLEPFKMSEGCGEQEVCEREIAVRLNGASQPQYRFLVAAENQLSEANEHHPRIRIRIARAEAERLLDAPALFLLAAAHRQRLLSDHQPDGTCC
jgi:hypothetical protein